ARILEIARKARAQDNRITDRPIFIVECLRREGGYDSAYADDYAWIHPEAAYAAADATEAERLEELNDQCGDTEGWQKVYYKDHWEFVTACFTEQGCKDYLQINGHNLGTTRIFAAGSYRNREWQDILQWLYGVGEFQK